MNLLEETVSEFGRSLGMENLQLTTHGSLVLDVGAIGTLALEVAGPRRESILISLTRPLPAHAGLRFSTLLATTHRLARLPVPMQLGLYRDQLVLAVALAPDELTLSRIHEVIQVLDQQHNAIGAGR